MEKVTYLTMTQFDGTTTEMVLIDRGNGEFTSMLKSTYEAQLAAHSTESQTRNTDLHPVSNGGVFYWNKL